MIRRAKDGLPARVSGTWTQERLAYVERGIDRKTGAEFDGSPLRALKVTPPFGGLYFSDVDARNVEALRQRITKSDTNRVHLRQGDCHTIAAEVVSHLSRGIGIERNLGAFARQAKAPLDDLIPGWRDLKRARLASGERLRPEEMAEMYHLLFFSQHPTGLTLWRNVTRVEPSGQRRLAF